MNEEINEEVKNEVEIKVAEPMVTAPAVTKEPIDQIKLWRGVSAVLALLFVGVLVKPIADLDQNTKSPNEAARSFIETVNKVYAPSVTNAVLGSVEEQHGMYLVKFTVDLDGQTMDQETFLTKDGEYIVPQAIAIADIVAQYEASQALEAATGDAAAAGGTVLEGEATGDEGAAE